ncbi:hypothetical protein HanPI659440_Chr14g0557171 [Helianthus annuus]|nr:hypothetical protein HanPI659440_Chr14g0557171 [Helianthus annuus]
MITCTSCEGNNVFLPSLSSPLYKPFTTLTLIPPPHLHQPTLTTINNPPPNTQHLHTFYFYSLSLSKNTRGGRFRRWFRRFGRFRWRLRRWSVQAALAVGVSGGSDGGRFKPWRWFSPNDGM